MKYNYFVESYVMEGDDLINHTRMYFADDAEHVKEQHEDSFPEETFVKSYPIVMGKDE